MLTCAEFWIRPADKAYINVKTVYYLCSDRESMHAIIIVRQFPPNDFFNKEVNLESRYGINNYFLCTEAYYNILITFLNVNNDLFISIDYLLNLPKWSNNL
jgi:hypothetical protein